MTKLLEEAGHDVTVSESATELTGKLDGFGAIVLNTLRQPATENDFSGKQRDGLKSYVEKGGGLVSVHISAASCPDWADMKKITGGGWVLGKSWHPPFGWFEVFVDKPGHVLAKGLPKSFWTYDECYCGLDIQPGIDVFMHGVVEGEDKPLGWSHKYGKGKVANVALGHAGSSQLHPLFRTLILNSVEFVTG
jgi:hypothetical protein